MSDKDGHRKLICPMCLSHGVYADCLEEDCMWYTGVIVNGNLIYSCAVAFNTISTSPDEMTVVVGKGSGEVHL